VKTAALRQIHLISNTKSGRGYGGTTLTELATRLCEELGGELHSYEISDSQDFEKQTDKAITQALKDGGIVVAAGGDGTIRGVAQKIHRQSHRLKLAFAVIPCGTFNYFARTHKIPEDHEAALRLALTGQPRPVRLGEVNGEVFLINASLGIYAKAIQEREKRTSRFGRRRIVASISTVITFLEKHNLMNIDLVADGKIQRLNTAMIFIGNNALQLRDLSLDVARCMKMDLLAVVTLKPLRFWGLMKLVLHGITGAMDSEENLRSNCVESLDIHTHRSLQTIALDGELFHMKSPLKVRALPRALNLILPEFK
jgi:diacylglycerol kinase family enzyme